MSMWTRGQVGILSITKWYKYVSMQKMW
jgi:hypothetical protein